MGYIERILGDNERVIYRTHRHWVFLLRDSLIWLLLFLVLLALSLVVITQRLDVEGNRVRQYAGMIAVWSVGFLSLLAIAYVWIRRRRAARRPPPERAEPLSPEARRLKRFRTAGVVGLVVVALITLPMGVTLLIKPELWRMGYLTLAATFVPLALLAYLFIYWLNDRFLITNRRVIDITGIIDKVVRDSALEKINDLILVQHFWARVLGYGNLVILTAAETEGQQWQIQINNPVQFKRVLLNAKEQLQRELPAAAVEEDIQPQPTRTTTKPAIAAASATTAPAPADIPDLILELDELRRKGLISDREFEAKKKQLLARM